MAAGAALLAVACSAPRPGTPAADPPSPPTLATADAERPQPLDRPRTAGRRSLSIHPILSTDAPDGDHGCGADLVGAEISFGDEEPVLATGGASACEAVLQARHRDTVLRANAGGHALWISDVAVASEEGAIVDARGLCAGTIVGACRNDFVRMTWQVRSIVGPLVGIVSFHDSAGGGGPPSGGDRWRAVDLRSGRPAPLDALVTEASLIEAIAGSPEIADQLQEEDLIALRAARTLDAVLAIPGLKPLADEDTGYAFAAGDPTGHGPEVTMLLGVRWPTLASSRPDIEAIVLRVVPRPEAAAWFAAAARGQGLLAER